jgi:L-lactate utilization protein LutC
MNRELLKQNFEKHSFQTSFFGTKEEAAAYICGRIKGATVGFGGSMTATAMELQKKLAEAGNTVYDHSLVSNEEKQAVRMKARDAEYYICSANGVSETGELVNIDGAGNRVSATLFGPKKVFFLVGKNKIEPTLDKAIERARNEASPKNCIRLHKKTPCAVKGDRCFDCSSPDRICNALVVYMRPMNRMEAEIVFIDEELGY